MSRQWTDVREGDRWAGLQLELPSGLEPGLRVEIVPDRHLLIRQAGIPMLAARVDGYREGVFYARSPEHHEIVKPVRAELTRRIATSPPPDRVVRWAYHFAAALAASGSSPLHAGRWVLQPQAPMLFLGGYRHLAFAEMWAELVLADRVGEIDWMWLNGAGVLLSRRALSAVDDSRVKAYRKQAREGSIAPILLWWIDGLTSYLILDGHDRLQACLAERLEPPMLALTRLAEDNAAQFEQEIAAHDKTVSHIEAAVARGALDAPSALAIEHRRLGEALRRLTFAPARTRAWPLPGGLQAWHAAAATIDEAWPARQG